MNLRCIRELVAKDSGDHDVVLHDETTLRLSRSHKDALFTALKGAHVLRNAEEAGARVAGFVQGEIVGREIHVIDRSRFKEEGSGFFVYPGGVVDTPVASMPLGSPCIVCHSEHGAYDSTFVQFYPALRGEQR